MKQDPIYTDWLKSVTAGEFLGFLIPSVLGAITFQLQVPQLVQALVMVMAGMGEGFVLGYFQAHVLAKHFAPFKKRKWIIATVCGAGAAWVIGMLPSTFSAQLGAMPLWLTIPVAVVLGVTLLLTIGFAQYLVLKDYVKNAHTWIWVNALAWLGGLSVVFLFIFAAPEGIIATILFSALGGLGMAFTMAAITGIYARKAMSHKAI
jgi:hypothetical protein